MKILFVLGSMTKGGAERVVANLSNNFCSKNEVSIIVTPPDKPMYELNPKINYYCLDEKSPKEKLITRNFRRISKLHKLLKAIKPDIILSFLPEPTYRLMIANFFMKYKTIISVRNDPNIEYNNFIKKMLVKLLYSRADGFVFQTVDAQKWFNTKIQRNSVIIPNPINPNFVTNPYTGTREKSIVTVGRLVEQKNHQFLIESFSIIHKKHPEYILKIYGDGPLKKELQTLITKLNLSKCIFLMGEVDDVKKEIYKAGMFVLTSNYEGMPNALMEAMAMGIPCISSNCPIGGPKFLINDGKNGYLYELNQKEELINKIEIVITNDMSKIITESCKISETLNPQKINDQWMSYIEKIKKEK